MLRLHGDHTILLPEFIQAVLDLPLETADLRLSVSREIVIPVRIANMLLYHHAIPLASGYVPVI